MSNILDGLNDMQQKAVLHDKGPLLVLAGAGSGKTRVITHRIAYLIEKRDVNPYNILAITFTNKAAKEMRERVDRIVGFGSENIWVSTFHSTCVRILRRFIESIGYERSFSIYDADDQKALMRDVLKYLNVDSKKYRERTVLSEISSAKDELIGPDEYFNRHALDPGKKVFANAYREYQKRLMASNALDFDDLIMKTVELFKTDEAALKYYQRRFKYILVDEYQDTNTAQFELIRILASTENEEGEIEHNLCVVGDDDQSIYKFRGANIRNILDFEQVYKDAVVIKLEQNYRSTGNILEAANTVIHNNLGRKDKSLWTKNEVGGAISYTKYGTDIEEAMSVTSDIYNKVRSEDYSYNDFAILYRTNAQSRSFEEKLIMKNIPYRLVGGVNFYQRKEIKDILAYLRTIDNGLDNMAVKRIVNVPKRGIGTATIDRLEEYATDHDISLYAAINQAAFIPEVHRALSKLESFAALIEGFKRTITEPGFNLVQLIDLIVDETGYIDYLADEDDDVKLEERRENIDELKNKLALYVDEQDEGATLSGFLEEVSLVGDIDSLDESDDKVILMTIHSAKGLEFPVVYMVGMEEGLFPSFMSINSDDPEGEIEEERRLCYVGITRAKKLLYLSSARLRMMRGETQYNRESRFINELPRHVITHLSNADRDENGRSNSFAKTYGFKQEKSSSESYGRVTASPYADLFKKPAKNFGSNATTLDFEVGDNVKHMKFGIGKVTNIVKGGKDYEVTVEFPAGVKKMLASFANLKKVE